MAKKGQRFKKYDLELKEKVLKEYLSGVTGNELARKYSIPRKTIVSWARKYKLENTLVPKQKGRPRGFELPDYKTRYEILKKFQDFLEEVDQEKK